MAFKHYLPKINRFEHFITTVFFEELESNIQLDWSMPFDTVEIHNIVVKANKGLEERLEKIFNNYFRSNLNRVLDKMNVLDSKLPKN